MVVFSTEYCCTALKKKKVPGYRANGSGFHHISLKSRRHPVSPWSSPRPWLRGRPRRRSPARCFLSRLSHWRRRRQRHSALLRLRTRAVGNSLGESWVRPNLDVFLGGEGGDVVLEIWVCLKMLCSPLYPMVLLIIIPMKNGYFIGNINPTFSDKPILILEILLEIDCQFHELTIDHHT